ncbi:peptidyl-prolyl cis-trans isomerase [Labrenzia sp. R4_2]|uniref:peptidylprolyl isomerase n=1 Tax=Labrenzia sp. R4_2 TaxID=2821107 RepID=UPI001AD9993B|nr:peptidylprolyl isomerase [Labrenzia sp. R4_2]MBO9419211.1 peptidyl-prolyl cis-trans isomerase [Labrenzia sp. R4_2]
MILKSFAKQPLVHFILIGGCVFGLYSLVSDKRPDVPAAKIVVERTDLDRLSLGFQTVWQRAPTETELKQLINAHIREEVLVREALALSLDRDDTVIRRRLRQKIDFLTRSAAAGLVPTDQELRSYLDANAERYRTEPSLGFQQVYLGETAGNDAIQEARDALNNGADPQSEGKAIMLPMQLPLTQRAAVDRMFGDGFFDRIEMRDHGSWSGPVQSAYGTHLVKVFEHEPAATPAYEAVRERLIQDWKEEQADAFVEAHYQRLLAQYSIAYPDDMMAGAASQ